MVSSLSKLTTTALVGCMTLTAGLGAASAQALRYGILPAGQDTYGQAALAGFRAGAEAAGVEVVFADSQWSVERMANNIEDMIAQQVNAVAIFPIDAVVAQIWVDNLVAAGIAAASSGSNIGDPAEHGPDWVYPGLAAVVVADLVEAGRIAGALALEVLPSDRSANIAIVQGAPGFAVNDQHYQGVIEALDAAGANYTIVADQPTDWSPESGEAVCANILTANPAVDVIFSFADPMSLGCARSTQAMGSAAKIISVTGGMQIGLDEVAAGGIYGGVCVRPGTMGRLLFDAIHQAVTSGNLQAGQYVGYELTPYTAANLADCVAEW